jgi:hypothetical protein
MAVRQSLADPRPSPQHVDTARPEPFADTSSRSVPAQGKFRLGARSEVQAVRPARICLWASDRPPRAFFNSVVDDEIVECPACIELRFTGEAERQRATKPPTPNPRASFGREYIAACGALGVSAGVHLKHATRVVGLTSWSFGSASAFRRLGGPATIPLFPFLLGRNRRRIRSASSGWVVLGGVSNGECSIRSQGFR